MNTIPVRENLELRILKKEDAEALFNLAQKNNAHLRTWLGWLDDDKSVTDTEKYIIDSEKRAAEQEGFDLLIWQDNQLVGGIALHPLDRANRKTSLMYWLAEEFQGQGIMLDSLKALIDYLFNIMKLNRIEIGCAIGNDRSAALPKKLGFTFEGISRQANWLYDHFVDIEVYSLLADEWKK